MTTSQLSPGSSTAALGAYEPLAAFYDDFTSGYDHASWLKALARLAADHGVAGGRVLDVACGTGKSCRPLLDGGDWQVTACDLSPAMVARARELLALDPDRCFVADMCALPRMEPVDLLLCLDDSVNYLESAAELERALRQFAEVLSSGGVAIFDVNTLRTYQDVFGGSFTREGELGRYRWEGLTSGQPQMNGLFAAKVIVEPATGEAATTIHRQRHFPRGAIELAARAADLRILAVRGQSEGCHLSRAADELTHAKFVYVLGHRPHEGVIA